MKTRLFWRKSWLNNNKDSFWIECTDEEVVTNIIPLRSDPEFLNEIEHNKGPSRINKNKNDRKYQNFFLVSTDLKNIISSFWVYPYSGMWNASNPFERITPIDFDDLTKLKEFQIEKF